MKEVEEIQTQFEDDIDTEIENLRRTYDDKLTASRETTLKLKGRCFLHIWSLIGRYERMNDAVDWVEICPS